MIVLTIVDERGVEASFIGNGDELTVAQEYSLRARLKKIGFKLIRGAPEPTRELEGYVKWLEEQEGD